MISNPLISVSELTKTFKTFERREGIFGAFYNLVKREYREVQAVNKISFEIEEGEFVGYIGPNGAGKSTTIKMLTGILSPTSGQIKVAGLVPWKQRSKYVTKIGVVFGQRTQLWWDIAVIESFKLLAKIYEIPEADFKKRLHQYSEILELDEFLHIPVRKLSLGQRMRCDLTASLLHQPKLLFLDEPSIGLDVLAKSRIRDFLQYLNETTHTTILLTTHDLDEIEKLCPRIILIDHGKKVYDGSLESLMDSCVLTQKILMDYKSPVKFLLTEELITKGILQYQSLNPYQGEVLFDRKKLSASDAMALLFSQLPVKDVEVQETSIEDVIRDIYEGKLHIPRVEK
jgi:ABC-2 type transport system ATP-binding protein